MTASVIFATLPLAAPPARAVPPSWIGDETPGQGTGSACSTACVCTCPGGEVVAAEPRPVAAPAGPAAEVSTTYPTAFIERPLVLTDGLTQAEIQITVLNNTAVPSSSTTEHINLGFDTQLGDRTQAGGLLSFSTDPKVDFYVLDGNAQYAINPFMNGRIDLGIQKTHCGPGGSIDYAFTGGLGLPIKYRFKFNERLAVISGNPFSYGYGDDLLTWNLKSCNSVGTFGLPLGLMTNFGENFMVSLRSGYRQLFGGGGVGASFVPVALDLVVSPGQQSDAGVTLQLPDGPGSPSPTEAQESYLFEKSITVWAQTRL